MNERIVICPVCTTSVGLRPTVGGVWVLRQHRGRQPWDPPTCAGSGQAWVEPVPPGKVSG